MDPIDMAGSLEKLDYIKAINFCAPTKEVNQLLFKLAAVEVCEDAYLTSPIYYQMTGRKGLWVYTDPDTKAFGFLCRHPNVENRLLVFPALRPVNSLFFGQMLAELPRPSKGVQLARFTQKQIEALNQASINNFRLNEESVLDWRYPCHVLSTQAVADLKGGDFSDARHRVNKTAKLSVETMPLNGVQDAIKCHNIVKLWFDQKGQSLNQGANCDYTESLFACWASFHQQMRGILLAVDGTPQGFWAWELPMNGRKQAIGHACVINPAMKGLPELGYHRTCQELLKQQCGFLNIGGSEQEGLDHFKRKFRPVQSYRLLSAEVPG